MQVWLFAASGCLRALAADDHGADLPGELGPWRLLKAVDLVDSDPDEVEAAKLIDLHGFCCFEVEGVDAG